MTSTASVRVDVDGSREGAGTVLMTSGLASRGFLTVIAASANAPEITHATRMPCASGRCHQAVVTATAGATAGTSSTLGGGHSFIG